MNSEYRPTLDEFKDEFEDNPKPIPTPFSFPFSAPTLTPKQRLAIESLLKGRTKIEAAAEAGVSYRTLHRWSQDPTFRTALIAASDATLADATHRLTGIFDEAVTVLAQIMNDEQAKEADRIRAANLIIDRGLELLSEKELHDRIAALEKSMGIDPY